MEKELIFFIKNYFGDTPFIATKRSLTFREGVILIFPRLNEEVDEFIHILQGAETFGFKWNACKVPILLARGKLELRGQWAAMEVARKPFGAA